jgi:hypothetical protein
MRMRYPSGEALFLAFSSQLEHFPKNRGGRFLPSRRYGTQTSRNWHAMILSKLQFQVDEALGDVLGDIGSL